MILIDNRTLKFIIVSMIVGVVFFSSYLLGFPNVMFISILFVFVCEVILFKGFDSTLFMGFLLSFFVFLLGRYTVLSITGFTWYYPFNKDISKCIATCLFLSLIFVGIGFGISSSKRKRFLSHINFEIDYEFYVNKCLYVKKTAKILFYLTYVFVVIEKLEAAIFVQNNTYLALYTSFSTSLPSIVYKTAQMNDFLFCIFCACLPKKKEFLLPTILFLLENSISLFSGVRGGFVYSTLFIMLYYLYRDKLEKRINGDEKWITRGMKTIILISMPIIIVLLSVYNNYRDGGAIAWNGFFSEILRFFKDQGGSANIIGYTEYYKKSLPPTNTSYFFGPVISLLKYGTIGSLFTGLTEMKNNTVEMALYGNNLGATISYYLFPDRWLSGEGLGTQYIAEAYADFGYMGVIVFNLFLGFLLSKANFITHKNWVVNALFINIILCILRMPRDNALSFVSLLLSTFNWFVVIIVYGISQIVKKNDKDC